MLFQLKKLVIYLVHPGYLFWLLITLAAIFWLLKHRRLAKLLSASSLLLVGLLSLYPVSASMLAYWEQHYPYLETPPEHTDLIVVIGGGHYRQAALPISSRLNTNSALRMAEALRLWRLQPKATLVFSGGKLSGEKDLLHADLLAEYALGQGVPQQQIETSYISLDTATEARALAQRYQGRSMLLVTDAAHMPRAMALFEREGLQPIAAPAYYRIRNWQGPWGLITWLPSLANLEYAEVAIRETIANVWVSWGGS